NDIVKGPDGNLWFTESSVAQIGRITTGGAVTEFSSGITPGSGPTDIKAGSDGSTLWFTENSCDVDSSHPKGALAKITTGGTVTEYTNAPNSPNCSYPYDLLVGPDTQMWF